METAFGPTVKKNSILKIAFLLHIEIFEEFNFFCFVFGLIIEKIYSH